MIRNYSATKESAHRHIQMLLTALGGTDYAVYTTAGGPYDPTYSYGYIESLAKSFFGIPETYLAKAELLDIDGYDADAILNREINRILKNGVL